MNKKFWVLGDTIYKGGEGGEGIHNLYGVIFTCTHIYFFLLLGLQLASFPPIVLLTQVFTPSEISLLFSYFSLACSSVSLFVLLHIFAFTRHCSVYFNIWRGHQDGCWSCLYTVRYCFYCRLHFGYRFVRLFAIYFMQKPTWNTCYKRHQRFETLLRTVLSCGIFNVG